MQDTVGEAKINLCVVFSYEPLPTNVPVLADPQELTHSSSVRPEAMDDRDES